MDLGLEESASRDSRKMVCVQVSGSVVPGRGPLASPWAFPLQPPQPCPFSSEQILAQRVRLAQPGGSWAKLATVFLRGWLQWDLLPLPPRVAAAPDTPQASSSPPPTHPPTLFPLPEAEVTGSPGLGWGCHHLAVGEEAGPWGLLS